MEKVYDYVGGFLITFLLLACVPKLAMSQPIYGEIVLDPKPDNAIEIFQAIRLGIEGYRTVGVGSDGKYRFEEDIKGNGKITLDKKPIGWDYKSGDLNIQNLGDREKNIVLAPIVGGTQMHVKIQDSIRTVLLSSKANTDEATDPVECKTPTKNRLDPRQVTSWKNFMKKRYQKVLSDFASEAYQLSKLEGNFYLSLDTLFKNDFNADYKLISLWGQAIRSRIKSCDTMITYSTKAGDALAHGNLIATSEYLTVCKRHAPNDSYVLKLTKDLKDRLPSPAKAEAQFKVGNYDSAYVVYRHCMLNESVGTVKLKYRIKLKECTMLDSLRDLAVVIMVTNYVDAYFLLHQVDSVNHSDTMVIRLLGKCKQYRAADKAAKDTIYTNHFLAAIKIWESQDLIFRNQRAQQIAEAYAFEASMHQVEEALVELQYGKALNNLTILIQGMDQSELGYTIRGSDALQLWDSLVIEFNVQLKEQCLWNDNVDARVPVDMALAYKRLSGNIQFCVDYAFRRNFVVQHQYSKRLLVDSVKSDLNRTVASAFYNMGMIVSDHPNYSQCRDVAYLSKHNVTGHAQDYIRVAAQLDVANASQYLGELSRRNEEMHQVHKLKVFDENCTEIDVPNGFFN